MEVGDKVIFTWPPDYGGGEEVMILDKMYPDGYCVVKSEIHEAGGQGFVGCNISRLRPV